MKFLISALVIASSSAIAADAPKNDVVEMTLTVDQALSIYNPLSRFDKETKLDKNNAQYQARMKFGSSADESEDVHWRLGDIVDALKPFVSKAEREQQEEIDAAQIDQAQAIVNQAAAECPAPGDVNTKVSVDCAKARLNAVRTQADHNRTIRNLHCRTVTVKIKPPTKKELNISENLLTPSEMSAFVLFSKSPSEIAQEARDQCSSDVKS